MCRRVFDIARGTRGLFVPRARHRRRRTRRRRSSCGGRGLEFRGRRHLRRPRGSRGRPQGGRGPGDGEGRDAVRRRARSQGRPHPGRVHRGRWASLHGPCRDRRQVRAQAAAGDVHDRRPRGAPRGDPAARDRDRGRRDQDPGVQAHPPRPGPGRGRGGGRERGGRVRGDAPAAKGGRLQRPDEPRRDLALRRGEPRQRRPVHRRRHRGRRPLRLRPRPRPPLRQHVAGRGTRAESRARPSHGAPRHLPVGSTRSDQRPEELHPGRAGRLRRRIDPTGDPRDPAGPDRVDLRRSRGQHRHHGTADAAQRRLRRPGLLRRGQRAAPASGRDPQGPEGRQRPHRRQLRGRVDASGGRAARRGDVHRLPRPPGQASTHQRQAQRHDRGLVGDPKGGPDWAARLRWLREQAPDQARPGPPVQWPGRRPRHGHTAGQLPRVHDDAVRAVVGSRARAVGHQRRPPARIQHAVLARCRGRDAGAAGLRAQRLRPQPDHVDTPAVHRAVDLVQPPGRAAPLPDRIGQAPRSARLLRLLQPGTPRRSLHPQQPLPGRAPSATSRTWRRRATATSTRRRRAMLRAIRCSCGCGTTTSTARPTSRCPSISGRASRPP